jgi:nucleoside-diphosphate-sugar epimerase
MSRCFPETADQMAAYRLHRGVDVRDVADAHVCALSNEGPDFQRFNVSGATPFLPSDTARLAADAAGLIAEREPELATIFRRRGWELPSTIDRVYSPEAAKNSLGWTSVHGAYEVIEQLDRRSIEVLPAGAVTQEKSE